jgi:hypothetical protein
MAIANVLFDTSAPTGSKLDPAMIAEIEQVAPGNIEAGEITAPLLGPEAVERDKIKLGAVDSPQIAAGGVKAVNMAAGSVATAALQDDAVTAAKAGLGVSTAYDGAGNPIEDKHVYLTSAQYNTIPGGPDPNTTYYILD